MTLCALFVVLFSDLLLSHKHWSRWSTDLVHVSLAFCLCVVSLFFGGAIVSVHHGCCIDEPCLL